MPKIDYTKKWEILTSLQNLPKNVGDLGKLNVAKGFKMLPKIQKIAKSGHTACHALWLFILLGKFSFTTAKYKYLGRTPSKASLGPT